MKKVLTIVAMGLMVACGSHVIAQNDAPAAPAENTCKNKVQVTDLSGTQQAGAQNFEYFIELKNVTDKPLFVDLKISDSEKFGHGTHIYSTLQKGIKIKPGKKQNVRFGNGTQSSMSVGTVAVQVDDFKEKKKPVIAIVNCREKK